MYASTTLRQGDVYTRVQLRELFSIGRDSTLNNGIFQPRDYDSIWLFVTENKTIDRTPYEDKLDGHTLYWDGQQQGRTDEKIIEHAGRGLELLVFYRTSKSQYPEAGFRYEGQFEYVSHSGAHPTHFILQRVAMGGD